ncbi:MAG: methyltransferase domain-containing protein [Clostridiales bacterium]|jgi:tRNA1Val (adenine37-N6)-methyltransferase|nr:methyltransferase domain-containing protein [Clostridiales bacterium]
MNYEAKPNERLDDLQCGGLQIIQRADMYRFSEDAVYLANFAKAKAGARVCDLGTGGGVIALLLSAKTEAREIVGVEIQADLADMAARSAAYNGLSGRVKILNAPMQEAHTALGRESFDVAVCNPPYFEAARAAPADSKERTEAGTALADSKGRPEIDGRTAARHETHVTLDEVAASAARLLKFGGRFYLIHRCERLADAFRALSAHRLEPKVLKLVKPAPNKPPLYALIEAVKGGKAGLKIEN